jgi:hypothetical protein
MRNGLMLSSLGEPDRPTGQLFLRFKRPVCPMQKPFRGHSTEVYLRQHFCNFATKRIVRFSLRS